jgi:hypothetical protein
VLDSAHEASQPMLLVGKGRHILMSTPGGARKAKTDEDKAIVTAARMGACRYVTNKVRGRDDGTTYEQLMADDHAGLAPLLSWIKVACPAGCIDIRCAPDKEKEARDDRKTSA